MTKVHILQTGKFHFLQHKVYETAGSYALCYQSVETNYHVTMRGKNTPL